MVGFNVELGDRSFTLNVTAEDLSYDMLLATIGEQLELNPEVLLLRYLDDEGDMVTMASDEDLLDAVECHGSKKHRIAIHASFRSLADMERLTKRVVDDIDAPVVVFEENVVASPQDEVPVVVANIGVPIVEEVKLEEKKIDPLEYIRQVLQQQPDLKLQLLSELGLGQEEAKKEEPAREVNGEAGEVADEVDSSECKEEGKPMIHEDIMCDNCKCNPIVGIRFKCTICNDFDLCADCEGKDVHPSGHPLMKIKVRKDRDEMVGVWRRKTPLPERRGHHHGARFFGRMANSNKLYAKFMGDSTIQDRSHLAPGSQHIKTWELQNSGPNAWPAGVKIEYLSGDLNVVDPASLEVTLPEVPANERCLINVIVNVPEQAGRYITYFRLRSPQGNRFGPRFWLDFFVPEKDVVEQKVAQQVVAAPVVAEVAPVDKDFAKSLHKWGNALMELKDMGLGEDASLNIFLLEKFHGDVARVVNWYLDQRRI